MVTYTGYHSRNIEAKEGSRFFGGLSANGECEGVNVLVYECVTSFAWTL